MAINQKKKYRIQGADLLRLVDMICLWIQIKPHLLTRLPQTDVASMEQQVSTGPGLDSELGYILDARPPIFALSFMPSQKEQAPR